MKRIHYFLNQPVNNASLTIFRMVFGFLLAAEGFGAIMTGWVKRVYVDTNFNFQFFGFEWLDIFHGTPMYFVFFGLGVCGLAMAAGYRYRLAILVYAVLWSIAYLGQKSSYNNHYYLMFLLCWFSVFIPMNQRFSLDVKLGRVKETDVLPFYLNYFFVAMFSVVYFYAAKNKIYPDWLDGRFISVSMQNKFVMDVPVLKTIVMQSWYPILVAYCAILYDGLIIPALIWKRTRKLAIFFSLVFHLYNSIVYQVGVFPYMSLAVLIFFVSDKWLERWIGSGQNQTQELHPKYGLSFSMFLLIMVIHFFMPLRHHVIEGNVFYTEEGHRCSWRMMLRSKAGYCNIFVKRVDGSNERINIDNDLSPKQKRSLSKRPDVLFAYVQRIKSRYPDEEIEIHANVQTSLNGRSPKPLIYQSVDLAKVKWNYFGHNDWVNSYGFEE